jgi:hypothetical protein|uniref:Uncharacterized protein n=1 Tax=Desulfomonile tiedjei TaxID=2358 RepID=A0A7C4EYK6_9BACT
MESMPFLHANRIFTITFFEDLAFADVRQILDHLLEADAFSPDVQAERGHYVIELDHGSFNVWVYEMEVIIQSG